MGKYENLTGEALRLSLGGGRDFMDISVGIGEYDDKQAKRFPSILKEVKEEVVEKAETPKVKKKVVEEVKVEAEKEVEKPTKKVKKAEPKKTVKKKKVGIKE